MPEVLVVAPAAFGREAEVFLGAASGRLPAARCALVASAAELERAAEGLCSSDVVIGSISSDLAIEVSRLCAVLGLQHVEAAALTDRILGSGSVLLTGTAADTATCIRRLLAGHEAAGLIFEGSEFGDAIRRGLDLSVSIRIEKLLDLGLDRWLEMTGIRSLAAALRAPWPERLCAAIKRSSRLELCVATGSWTRPEVARAAAPIGDRLCFCEVRPASMLRPSELEPRLRSLLATHLRRGSNVYADLGLAAADLVGTHVIDAGCSLWDLDLGPAQTLFGHGFKAGPDGRNLKATKTALRWAGGVLKEVL